jgi:AsmA protein
LSFEEEYKQANFNSLFWRWIMKAIKWIGIVVGALIILIILALLIVPKFVDVQKYKPEIEQRVAKATGRPFRIGGNLELSLFPWVGLSFSDLHLGNPAGFAEKDFLSVRSFDVKVRLFPLLFKDVQVKRFLMEGPRIVLERDKNGRGNWEGIGKPEADVPAKPAEKKEGPPKEKPSGGIPLKGLAVGDFSIREGSLLWIDQAKGDRRELKDLTVRLRDVSLDRPIKISFSALLDNRRVSLQGKIGPLGKEPGKGTVPVEVLLKALDRLDIKVQGKLVDPAISPRFDLAIEVAQFSPKKLMKELGQPFPVTTTDPGALDRIALKARVEGDRQAIALKDGALDLDDSKLIFSAKVKDFVKPDMNFDARLDQIDLDRYLPPPSEKPTKEEKAKVPYEAKKKTDYAPLRTLVLDGEFRAGKIKMKDARVEDIHLKVHGRNGLIDLDPLSIKLYQGMLSAKGSLDVRRDSPKTDVNLKTEGVKVRPLINDVLKKDFLEGNMGAQMALHMEGDDADMIRKTLTGNGDFRFSDGAIVGIDLAGMVRNVQAAFGLAEKGKERPRTDFSELHSPFTISSGVVNTPKTTLMSPLIRVLASGDADLVKETLNFRVEPKLVTTLKGQGDTEQRSGLMVPVLVTGTFSSPKFRPDLKGMLKEGLEKKLPQVGELKEIIEQKTLQKDTGKTVEEKAKGLLKGLPFGK